MNQYKGKQGFGDNEEGNYKYSKKRNLKRYMKEKDTKKNYSQ